MSKRKSKLLQPAEVPLYDCGNGQDRTLPFDLPAARIGSYRIEHKLAPAGQKQTIVSMRNAIFMGLATASMTPPRPLLIHKLRYQKGIWMTSYPQEVEQHERQLQRAFGHVLLGGLGLGLAIGILTKNPKVKSITVVEKSKHVIDLVEPHLPREKDLLVIKADLFQYLFDLRALNGNGFDFAFYDIWAPTGQTILTTHTMPLRGLSIGLCEQRNIECWNEKEMLGQVALGLFSRLKHPSLIADLMEMPEADFRAGAHMNRECFPFFNWMRQKKHNPAGIHAAMGARRYIAALSDAEAFKQDWQPFVAKAHWRRRRKAKAE